MTEARAGSPAPHAQATDGGGPVAGEGRPSLAPILAVNFVGTLGFSIVLPFLVFLVTRWGGNALVYGFMGATYSAFQLVGAPVLGRWSDIRGRRKILLLSQLGTLLSWGIFVIAFFLPVLPLAEVDSRLVGSFTLSLPLLVLFVARAADGITGGNVSVANAYLADITPEQERSTNFGKMAVSANLGFVIGPALAGLLGGTVLGELPPVLAALSISAVATGIILFRLPESRPCILSSDPAEPSMRRVFGQEPKDCFQMLGAEKPAFRDLMRLERVPLLLAIYFLAILGFSFFYVSFPMQAVVGLEWTVRQTGALFAVLSLMMALVQGPVLGRAAKRFDDVRLVRAGSLILAASFPLFGGAGATSVYLGAALLALGNGLMWPSVISVLSKAAGSRYQGAVQGLAGSLGSAASIAGFLVGGLVFDAVAGRTFMLSAAAIFVVFLLAWGLGSSALQTEPTAAAEPAAAS
jgi:MFS family permease